MGGYIGKGGQVHQGVRYTTGTGGYAKGQIYQGDWYTRGRSGVFLPRVGGCGYTGGDSSTFLHCFLSTAIFAKLLFFLLCIKTL